MTWNTERSKSGKQPWQWVEIEIERCTRVYGDAYDESPPDSAKCMAEVGVTGDSKCFNGWQTCQWAQSFNPETFWVRFCEPVENIPRSFIFNEDSPPENGLDVFLPFLRNVTYSSGLPDPGESLGMRSRLDIELSDAPHHDRGIDKYIDERPYNAIELGTFLRKLKARFPFYIGRRMRWYQGYITDNPSLADFRKREFIMERLEGPNYQGRVKIISKDVLKLLDNERAQAPLKSSGELNEALTSGGSNSTIDVIVKDTTEYDISDSPAIGWVRIGAEVIQYTGVTVLSDTEVRLTGVTRNTPPSGYTTESESHDVGDAVQLCKLFEGTIPSVVYDLMVNYGDIDPSFIDYSDWDTEATTWLASDDIKRLVVEPEGVKELIDEIIGQTLVWGFWFDEVEQKIKFRAIRPADVNDIVEPIDDDANIVMNSVKVADAPDRIINEVQVVFGQIDPTKKLDDLENYRRGLAVVDANSQSVNELNQKRIKRIYARWNPSSNGAVVLRYAERTLASRSKNIFNVEFELERKDENIKTAEFADLTTLYIIDEFGIPRTTRVQVLRSDASGEVVKYKAREDFFRGLVFGRWAPGSLSGLMWGAANLAQQSNYLFWADSNGQLGSLDSPPELTDGKTWA